VRDGSGKEISNNKWPEGIDLGLKCQLSWREKKERERERKREREREYFKTLPVHRVSALFGCPEVSFLVSGKRAELSTTH
jgi:hypothetical protein